MCVCVCVCIYIYVWLRCGAIGLQWLSEETAIICITKGSGRYSNVLYFPWDWKWNFKILLRRIWGFRRPKYIFLWSTHFFHVRVISVDLGASGCGIQSQFLRSDVFPVHGGFCTARLPRCVTWHYRYRKIYMCVCVCVCHIEIKRIWVFLWLQFRENRIIVWVCYSLSRNMKF